MRILQLAVTLSAKAGGPPMVVTRLAAAQAGLGHRVTLCAYETPAGEAEAPVDIARARGNLENSRIPLPGMVERVYPRVAMAYLRELLRSADILHIHSIWNPICLGASMVAGRLGVPYALAPHGMLDPWALSVKPVKKRFFLSVAYNRLMRRAAVLHALSQYEADSLGELRYGVPIAVIPNGVFLEEIDPLPEPGSFHAAHPELQGEPYALFLGRLHAGKGLDVLVEAFAELPQRRSSRLVIIGPDWGARAALEAQLDRLGVRDRVHLMGTVYGREKFAALTDAACFVLPSIHEAFSVAVVEALAARCPVVISEQCHFPEAARAGAGCCVKREPRAVGEAVGMLLADGPLRHRMGAAGRALVEERYTWPKIAGMAVDAYQQHAVGAV